MNESTVYTLQQKLIQLPISRIPLYMLQRNLMITHKTIRGMTL